MVKRTNKNEVGGDESSPPTATLDGAPLNAPKQKKKSKPKAALKGQKVFIYFFRCRFFNEFPPAGSSRDLWCTHECKYILLIFPLKKSILNSGVQSPPVVAPTSAIQSSVPATPPASSRITLPPTSNTQMALPSTPLRMVLPPLPARISSPQLLPEGVATFHLEPRSNIAATPFRQTSRPLPNPPDMSVSPFANE